MRESVLERTQRVLLSYNCSFTCFVNELNEIMPVDVSSLHFALI